MALQLITTGDGSHSLLNTDLNETYHSVHGAVQESQHVFIKHGLAFYIQEHQPTSITILEIGFGTGLNALLTLSHVQGSMLKINYVAIEPFPVAPSIVTQIKYPADCPFPNSTNLFDALHQAEWNKPVAIAPNFILEKRETTLQEAHVAQHEFDLIYFDAFAPNKQPEMWQPAILANVAHSLANKGVFVTYCAKGQVKRDLKSAGLVVQTLPGPPGKREMVRATKQPVPSFIYVK